jgi:hypothetical protein
MGKVIPATAAEIEFILANRDTLRLVEIARQLGRSDSFVWNIAKRDGWRSSYYMNDAAKQKLVELAALGYCNKCIGRAVNKGRKEIRNWRPKLGLAPYAGNGQGGCSNCSDRTRERTKQQLAKAGLKSLAEVRIKRFREYAAASGWPSDLRPRHVQILDALYVHGPHTRRQLCERLGMPWKGSRKSLVSNDPEGSYLAHLQARGLVLRTTKRVPLTDGVKAKNGKRSGKNVYLYLLPLGVQPNRQQLESV